MKVIVLGASPKPERYSNKAVKLLIDKGYEVLPVNPRCREVHGVTTLKDLSEISGEVYAISVYLNPESCMDYIKEIQRISPQKVILNPGTESDELETKLKDEGITAVKVCTIVLLTTGQF